MKQIRTRPPPPRLEGSVGTAYLAGKLSVDVVDQGEVEADDVNAGDVRSVRNTADDTCAKPQEASPASVVDGPLASAPDIAIVAAGAETQEEKQVRKH